MRLSSFQVAALPRFARERLARQQRGRHAEHDITVLTLLKISGFALIDEAEIAFGPGLTAVTGETGAGKSILVEALGLLRGARAGADLIRTGRDEARVEAIVELPESSAARARLLADGRAHEDGLVVRRTIARGGRGRAHLGGSLATAADLAGLVGPLIDIASQHDQQSLTDPESQLAILDAFAENAALRERDGGRVRGAGGGRGGAGGVRRRRARARRTRGLCSASSSASSRPRARCRARSRRWPPNASACAAPSASTRRRRAARRRCTRATAPSASGSRRCCATSSRSRRWIRRWRPRSNGCARRRAAVEDVARDLGRYARGVRSDPARLAEIDERLFLLSRLTRKHGGTVADLAARRDALAAELAEVASYDDALAARQAAADQADARAAAAAAAAVRVAQAARRAASRRRSPPPCASSASRAPGCPCCSRRASWGATGARSRALPVRAQSGRGAAPAREDRLGRRAVAGDAGGQAGARADRPGADLRVRRGRRGRGRRRPPR